MIGLVTIGQSPRDDVVPSMFPGMDPVNLVQAGALDDLSDNEIDALYPSGSELPLVTRLADGREVVIAKPRISPLMEQAIARLEDQGATMICVLCTGEFALKSRVATLIYPDKVLAGVVDGLFTSGKLGVLMPHAGQIAWALEKWSRPGRQVVADWISPYQAEADPKTVFERIAAQGVAGIVLDCMGFDAGIAALGQRLTGLPIIQANRMVGSVLTAMNYREDVAR